MAREKVYFGVYIGVIRLPIAWFIEREQAVEWARRAFSGAIEPEVRPFLLSWAPRVEQADRDEKGRPRVFHLDARPVWPAQSTADDDAAGSER